MVRATPIEIQAAIEVVKTVYGVTPSLANPTAFVRKFGSRSNVTTAEVTVMDLEGEDHEVLLTTNGITSIVSEDVGDTMDLVVEGHTIASGVLTRVVQTVTMDGRTAVTLGTALGRVERVSNETGVDLTGPVYVYEGGAITLGKPDDDTANHLIIPTTAHNQSEKAALSTAFNEYIFLTSFSGSVLKKTSATVDIEIQMRLQGGVWRKPAPRFSVSSAGTLSHDSSISPPLIVPPNSDVRILCAALSGTGIEVEAKISGYYART